MKTVYMSNDQLIKLNKFLGNSKVKGDDVDFFQNMRNMFSKKNTNKFELSQADIKKLITILNTTFLKGFEANSFVSILDSLLTDNDSNVRKNNKPVLDEYVHPEPVYKKLNRSNHGNKSFTEVLDMLKGDGNLKKGKKIDDVLDKTNEEIIDDLSSDDISTIMSEEVDTVEPETETETEDTETDSYVKFSKDPTNNNNKPPVNIPFNAENVDPDKDNAARGFFSNKYDEDYL